MPDIGALKASTLQVTGARSESVAPPLPDASTARSDLSAASVDGAVKALGPAGGICRITTMQASKVWYTRESYETDKPPEWGGLTVYGVEGPSAIYNDWCGGMAIPADGVIVYGPGGGHAGYGANDVYADDIANSKHVRVIERTPLSGYGNKAGYVTWDGKPLFVPLNAPPASHTYDLPFYYPPTKTCFVPTILSVFPQGTAPTPGEVWEVNPHPTETRNGLAPKSWRLSKMKIDASQMRGSTDSLTSCVVLPDGDVIGISYYTSRRYNPITGIVGPAKQFNIGAWTNSLYDSKRKVIWCFNSWAGLLGKFDPVTMTGQVMEQGRFGWADSPFMWQQDDRWIYFCHASGVLQRYCPETRQFQAWVPPTKIPGSMPGSKGMYLAKKGVAFVRFAASAENSFPYVIKTPEDAEWRDTADKAAQSFLVKGGGTVKVPPGMYTGGLLVTDDADIDLKDAVFGSTRHRDAGTAGQDGKSRVLIDNGNTKRMTVKIKNAVPGTDIRNVYGDQAAVRASRFFDLTYEDFDEGYSDHGFLIGDSFAYSGASTFVARRGTVHHTGGSWGQTHPFYVSEIALAFFEDVTVHHAGQAGNSFKSRAGVTNLRRCKSLGGDQGNRPIDVPNGGVLTVESGLFIKDPRDDDVAFISYAREVAARPTVYHRWPVNMIRFLGQVVLVNRLAEQARVLDLPPATDPSYPTSIDASNAVLVLVGNIALGKFPDGPWIKRYATEAGAVAAGVSLS